MIYTVTRDRRPMKIESTYLFLFGKVREREKKELLTTKPPTSSEINSKRISLPSLVALYDYTAKPKFSSIKIRWKYLWSGGWMPKRSYLVMGRELIRGYSRAVKFIVSDSQRLREREREGARMCAFTSNNNLYSCTNY